MASDHIQSFIQNYYDDLCEELDVAAIAGKLFAKKIIDFARRQEIRLKGSTKEANTTFADYFYRHANKDTVDRFLQILEKDSQYPKHKDLGAAMRKEWAELLCDSRSESEGSSTPMPPEPLGDQRTNDSVQQQLPKVINNGTDCAATMSLAELNSSKTGDLDLLSSEPTGDVEEGERQDDMPKVEEVSADASKKFNPDYNFPRDEPVPEDEVEEEIPAKPVPPIHTGSKKKSVSNRKSSSTVSPSQLAVVCFPCLRDLANWKCIRRTGHCTNPSHKKVYQVRVGERHFPIREKSHNSNIRKLCAKGYFDCKYSNNCIYAHMEEERMYWKDPIAHEPALELCKDCRWEQCLELCQRRCLTGAHTQPIARTVPDPNVVVCKAEEKRTLVEIRCPKNYLSMRNKPYHFTHTQHGCTHYPYYTCAFPHSEIEEEIWNVWKGRASANVTHRTARMFMTEIIHVLKEDSDSGQHNAASMSQGAVHQKTQVTRPTSSKDTTPERKAHPPLVQGSQSSENKLLAARLTPANYKQKFHRLNDLEEKAHVEALKRCGGSFPFQQYTPNQYYDQWLTGVRHQWYGSLEVPQYLGDHVRQAATHVELEQRRGKKWELTADIIPSQKFLDGKHLLLLGFETPDKPQELSSHKHSRLNVEVTFLLKHRYFVNLRSAIRVLPDDVLPKLIPDGASTQGATAATECENMMKYLPSGFNLDEEYQGPTCRQLLRSTPDVPFLVTGPFGTGKTRLIAAAVYCILKTNPQSRILIATHHRRTADEYIESYFTDRLVAREGLAVVRLVGNDTPHHKLHGLMQMSASLQYPQQFQLIVTTFIVSMGLSRRLKAGHFSHIFIDEGAQAREPETIAAFSVAGRNTKIVIAGDHKQVGPKTSVLGEVPRESGLSDSLLVRLHDLYSELPGGAAHQSKLLINYRSHPDIVRLPSRLFYDCNIRAASEIVPHPEWDKIVYFVCSSLKLKEPVAGSKGTQEELLEEAKLEVEEVKQLVTQYLHKQSPKGKATSVRKSSVCVMFPTRLTETLWKGEVHHSPELKQVTYAVAYDIQGREFDAIFVCTAQPVNEDYSPFDPVKSMCDPYMFNTIITRPKSLIVVIGNPFRLRKIEKTTPHSPACWSEYLYQCWEGGSLLLSARLRDDPGACKKQLDELEGVMFQRAADKLRRVNRKTSGKEEGKNGKKDTIMLDYSGDSKNTALQSDGWRLDEKKEVILVKGEQVSGSCTECKLNGYTAIPTKLGLKTFVIPSIDERRCAFDGATVLVEETEQQIAGRRTGNVVRVKRQGPVDPMICSVDSLSPVILTPVSGKNPKILNLPIHIEAGKEPKLTKETAVEAVVNCYSLECPTRSVDAISFKAAHDMFFIVQPLEWSVQERYPIGAVVGVLPKCPPLRLAEKILAVQHKVSQSKNFTPGTASSKAVASPPPLSGKPVFKTAIGIRDPTGICNITFSVEGQRNHFIMAVHVSNVMDHLSEMDEFKKKRFNEWSASHPVLPQHVVQACDFTETPIQKAITVEFKVEDPTSTFDVATRKNILVAQPSVMLVSIQKALVQCSNMLTMSDAEYILRSLQAGCAADGKLARGTAMSVHDALAILYCTTEHLHKTRHGHGGYPLLEMASYEFPETAKMVNELLTLANSEAAKKISEAFPDRALMVTQTMPDYSKEEIAQFFSEDLALLPEPSIYSWLIPQGQTRPRPIQSCVIVTAHLLKLLIAALKEADFLEARQLLHFLHHHPQFVALQEAVMSALSPEHFSVGSSQSVGTAPTHCIRRIPYTSFTDPLRSIGDVYVQEQLLAAVGEQDPPRSIKDEKDIAMNCNRARLNAKGYKSARAKLNWAHFAQQTTIRVQAVVKSVESGILNLCLKYDRPGNMLESIAVPVPTLLRHSDYTAKVTKVDGLFQELVGTTSEHKGGRGSSSVQVYGEGGSLKGNASFAPLVPTQTVQVPTDTLHTVVDCINTFDEEKAAKVLKLLQHLEKQEHKSPNRRGPPTEPQVQNSHFLLLECPLPLSPHQVVDVWMRMDTSQFIATPQPQLLEIGHSNVRVCLHHTQQPEACFTSGSNVQAPQQIHSSVESYVSEWGEVLLAEAACRSVGRKRHILIDGVRICFNTFEALDFASEQFYRPVGNVTALLSKAFMEDRQDIFPLEQGDLVCARYEVDLMEAGLELLERHGNCFPPQHKPVGRLVLHMVVERVVMEGAQQEVMMSQEVVQSAVAVYLRVVGEQGAHISPLMRDLLVTNKHPCQMEVVPMEPNVRNVYQSLRRLPSAATNLAVDIMLGDLKAFKTSKVMEHPTFDELIEECPNVEQMHESIQQLNADQRAALERAYQSKFHIIQGPPGTEELAVAVHLAYAFAQKNKRIGLRKATGMQHCVLLCAPDDAAVDTTLSLLETVAGSSEKDIRVLRIYSREVERKHCPGPYQDTNVFEVTATVDYRVPQEMEKFALHNLICSKMEETIQYSKTEMPSPAQRSKYRWSVAEAERQVIQEGQFDVVLCTCSEASSARVQRHFIPFQCIVYEASLATEPETVAAIARSSHQVVLIGDHSSVCPPVCSQKAGLAGLGVSLFERYARQLIQEDEYGVYSFLEEQYRMVEPLCDFPSREFYNGQLNTSPTLNLCRYPELDLFWPKGNRQPLVFCNVKGREETEQLKSAEDTIVNRVEAEKVVDIIQKVVTALSGGKGKITKETLAVLTSTEAQKSLIQGLLLQTDMDKTVTGLVRSQVMTISASRGAKANIVILSTTRSCPPGAIPKDRTALLDHQWKEEHLGLLCRPHHTCLALTTGKHGLVIIGDMDLLSLDDKWCHLVKHCSDKGCLVDGNAFPSQQFIESQQQAKEGKHRK